MRLGRTASELAEHLATKAELIELLTVAIEQLDAEGAREAFLTRLRMPR